MIIVVLSRSRSLSLSLTFSIHPSTTLTRTLYLLHFLSRTFLIIFSFLTNVLSLWCWHFYLAAVWNISASSYKSFCVCWFSTIFFLPAAAVLTIAHAPL